MRSEAKKSFYSGFDLTEQELRRIFDTMMQQVAQVSSSSTPQAAFGVKFRNGVIAEPANLDEILNLENSGSGAVVRLQLVVGDNREAPSSLCTVNFSSDSGDEPSDWPGGNISYIVTGDDKNWVFLTSSQLDERLSRIARPSPRQITRFLQGPPGEGFLIGVLMLLTSYGLVFSFAEYVINERQLRLDRIESIETRWKNGEIEDAISALIELERALAVAVPDDYNRRLHHLWPLGIFLVLLLLWPIWWYLSPSYNFLWGDYVKVFEKRKTARNVVVVVFIIGIIVSIVGNYFSYLLGIGR